MYRSKSILRAALAIVLIHASLTLAVGYALFSGYNDEEYHSYGKYKMFGLIDAFDGMGLQRDRYMASTPWQFHENSFIDGYRDYSYPEFDSARADYSTVTVHCGHAGTFRDPYTKDFYLIMQARDLWQGSDVITSGILRLGESYGYFYDDIYRGYCRYFLALGCNTVTLGPPMSDSGTPTYSRPDLFDKYNPNHANPFKIWGPVMTDGLRLVMGHTDFAYGSDRDRDKWRRFKDYRDSGYSIAWAFANTALDAHDNHKPVVMAMGNDLDECVAITNERNFQTSRPSGNNWLYYIWWGSDRVRNYNGPYVWSQANEAGNVSAGSDISVNESTRLPTAAWSYESTDSATAEDEALVRYLDVFGLQSTTTLFGRFKEQATYKISDKRQICINRGSGSLYYQDAGVLAQTGPCGLSQDECILQASAFLLGNKIVGPNEVEIDSVISVNWMAATTDEIATGSYSSNPVIARYIIVFKRKLGNLPVLTNDTDTIRVEIGQNGKIASLVSHYKYGRRISALEATKGRLPNVRQAKAALSPSGVVRNVKAGILPADDGTYLPVYEVTTLASGDELLPRPQVTYHRMDTLELVKRDTMAIIDGYELGTDEATTETGR